MKSKITFCGGRWLALLASGAVFIAGCGNKDAEVAAQRQKELEAVRAELQQVKSSAAAKEDELTQLRKDHLELLKLRNEVRKLGDDKKQLSQQAQTAEIQAQRAQAEAQIVRSQAQQVLAAQQQALAARANAPATSEQQLANACINNLRQIDGAMQQWALENKKDANAIPTVQDLTPYFKNGVVPKCPAGGVYTITSVGTAPTCSIPGHALPK